MQGYILRTYPEIEKQIVDEQAQIEENGYYKYTDFQQILKKASGCKKFECTNGNIIEGLWFPLTD